MRVFLPALVFYWTVGHNALVHGAAAIPSSPQGNSTAPAGAGPSSAPAPPPPGPPPGAGGELLPPGGAEDVVSCTDKRPCHDKNSKCIDGHCLCNEGFAPIGNDTCFKSPDLGDPCRINGQEFGCAGFGVDYNCPANSAVCQCRPGYEPDTKDACKAAVRLVGATCKMDGDCTASFTTCQGGKCDCIEGFKSDGKNLCNPTAYTCLGNDKPLEEKGTVKLCEVTVNPQTGDIGNDTCPSTHFCNNWQNSFTTRGALPGHCCPKPTSPNVTATCPVGLPHKTGKCPDLSQFPADAPLPENIGPLCPLGTYDCFRGRICCPLACRSSNSHFNVDGKCYDSVLIDQPCRVTAQCLPGAECTNGTCQCKPGYRKASPTLCLEPGQPSPFGPVP